MMEQLWRERAEAAERLLQKTTLEEYLRDCYHIFKALRTADKPVTATGRATRVNGKRYPMRLRRWSDFANTQQDYFDTIDKVFGDKRLFPQSIATLDKVHDVCRRPAAFEHDIKMFENVAIESPVQRIFEKLLEEAPHICDEFNFAELRFTNNNRELKQPDDADAADAADEGVQERRRRSGPSKRAASEQTVQPPTYPDGLGLRKYPKGGENLAFVFDYKAAHKLTVQDLKLALVKENFFMEVIQQVNSNKTKTDAKLNERDNADQQIAMALTQVFDYMIQRGVVYGYVTAGKALVLLHIKLDNTQTLYYHLCVLDEDADFAGDDEVDDEGGDLKVSKTAVAQLASFCLLTLRSEALQGSALEDLWSTAKLKRWPEPYDKAEEHLGAEDTDTSVSEPSSQETIASLYETKAKIGPAVREYSLRSRASCKNTEAARRRDDEDDEDDDGPPRVPAEVPGTSGSNKRKGGPSSGSSEDSDQRMSSDSDSRPTRQYCTQACLLGLKRGWDLDDNCPNASSHRTAEGGNRHAISASEFTVLVGERLRQNKYRNCVAVDPHGLAGKIGAIGALFKLELAPYGYTFVGKGTQSAHLCHLRHESLVYSRLERLQGDVVPVYLGIVDLPGPWGYVLPGGARILHMMLMSWGGEVATDASVQNLAVELSRSEQAVWSEGVAHGDKRDPNILWNEERRRVMLIDFDRAALRPAVKHKQLLTLSGNGKKRKRQGDIPKMYGQKRAMMY
ncbi:hypothetical protein F5Y07DRAFT_382939 [Xylaria sp. FL0933]|nr:hypothetical protein F5Y07DRAFT_382939 [Xylaria sp. FL0933]